MFASVLTAAIYGMEAMPVHVEADVSDGLPSFVMVGFPSAQVKEAQDRVRTALRNNGFRLPPKRVTVNFMPADQKKQGAGFDLPVAVAVMAAAGILPGNLLKDVMIVGELGLNGEIHGVPGVLPRVLCARDRKLKYCVIPRENLSEGRLVKDLPVIGAGSLKEMIQCLKHPVFDRTETAELPQPPEEYPDFADICGQEGARRAAEIAVSGFHNLLLIGPPGSGKTMLAKRIPGIMPDLSFEESLELTKIYSVAGLLSAENPLITRRSFRSPHHSSTPSALVGGGYYPRPGEITLAHRSVLFLDEMPEFSRKSLEILRQPMEDKVVQLSRAGGTYLFPADFMLVAAMNPCPCGYYPDMNRCSCTAGQIQHYLGKISRPLLDRIDICTEVPEVEFEQMNRGGGGEATETIRRRVERTRQIQKNRYKNEKITCNGELSGKNIQKYCVLTEPAEQLMEHAFSKMKFSLRAFHRILKVARTIADMDGEERIHSAHAAEALSYRALDQQYWSL